MASDLWPTIVNYRRTPPLPRGAAAVAGEGGHALTRGGDSATNAECHRPRTSRNTTEAHRDSKASISEATVSIGNFFTLGTLPEATRASLFHHPSGTGSVHGRMSTVPLTRLPCHAMHGRSLSSTLSLTVSLAVVDCRWHCRCPSTCQAPPL